MSLTPGKTPQEFIKSAFTPTVAVLQSPKVHSVVSKNNLSFTELLQPFTTLDYECQFREPNGTLCIVKNLQLTIKDVHWKPLQPIEARRQLNDAVLNNYHEKTVDFKTEGPTLKIPLSTVWFDAWRETYLEVQFPSDHEFTKHYLSCMVVATTLDDNIVDTINNLNQEFTHLQNVVPPKLPKWFNSSVLKSYVLLHDASCVAKEKADAIFETMKQNFEASNCFMLSINSRSTVDQLLTIDLWSKYIKRNVNMMDPSSSTIAPTTTETHAVTECESTTQEQSHPLTNNYNETYDSANNLQTHSLSGSIESLNTSRTFDSSTEVHGSALCDADIDAIKQFILSYVSKALIPYIERQVTVLTEAVANKKGVSRSLLSATKRWFGTGKGGANTSNNTVIYSSECPELQLRRLSDLWFMCGQWSKAFESYHSAKREFYADGAWLCYAGALEMAAVSAFMAGEANKKTNAYIEESINTYLNTCRMVQYAVRATLLSSLVLNSMGSFGESAKQLIRMTAEDSDLRSAMLLEQAAMCFLSGPGNKPMHRKYAFHIVLAGHRFSKAGQKKHAYRCYQQAYQVYTAGGWRLSLDHVSLALGRLCMALRRSNEAPAWLASVLKPYSPHHLQQQLACLRDYVLAQQQCTESSESRDLPSLPVPLIEQSLTMAVFAGPAPLASPGRVPATSVAHSSSTSDNKYWHKMEEMLLQVAKGSLPMIFKPTIDRYTTATEGRPSAPQGEPIQIIVTLRNPLKVPLVLSDLELLWKVLPKYSTEPDVWLANEPYLASNSDIECSVIFGQKIPSVCIEGEQEECLTFSLTPMQEGQLIVYGLAYKLVLRKEDFSDLGKNIVISGKLDLQFQQTGLQISVVPCAPCLQMTLSETSPEFLSCEIRTLDVELSNVGPVNMKNLHIAVSHPDCIQLYNNEGTDFKDFIDEKYRPSPQQMEERAIRALNWTRRCSRHVRLIGSLESGARTKLQVLLRPRVALSDIYLLAYYEPEDKSTSHRLLKHVFRLNVTEAIDIKATPRRSVTTKNSAAFEKMSIVLETKNVIDEKHDMSLEILECSLLSRQWQLTNSIIASGNTKQLFLREKLHSILEANRILDLNSEGLHVSSLKVTKGNISSQTNIQSAPYSKFVIEYNATLIDDEAYAIEETNKNGLIQSMLVVRWQATNRQGKHIIGQNCLWIECFNDNPRQSTDSLLLDLYNTTDSIKRPLADNIVLYKMEHSNHVEHNFKERRLCVVPVKINVVNCYGTPVKAFIDISKKSSNSNVGWAGCIWSNGDDGEGICLQVNQFQSKSIQVFAMCTSPGTYTLGSEFKLSTRCLDTDKPVATRISNDSSLLVVQNCC